MSQEFADGAIARIVLVEFLMLQSKERNCKIMERSLTKASLVVIAIRVIVRAKLKAMVTESTKVRVGRIAL